MQTEARNMKINNSFLFFILKEKDFVFTVFLLLLQASEMQSMTDRQCELNIHIILFYTPNCPLHIELYNYNSACIPDFPYVLCVHTHTSYEPLYSVHYPKFFLKLPDRFAEVKHSSEVLLFLDSHQVASCHFLPP
jgi:hypothetical protein